jgi:hypothetical protein
MKWQETEGSRPMAALSTTTAPLRPAGDVPGLLEGETPMEHVGSPCWTHSIESVYLARGRFRRASKSLAVGK